MAEYLLCVHINSDIYRTRVVATVPCLQYYCYSILQLYFVNVFSFTTHNRALLDCQHTTQEMALHTVYY